MNLKHRYVGIVITAFVILFILIQINIGFSKLFQHSSATTAQNQKELQDEFIERIFTRTNGHPNDTILATAQSRAAIESSNGKSSKAKSSKAKSSNGKSSDGKSSDGKSSNGKSSDGKSSKAKSSKAKSSNAKSSNAKSSNAKSSNAKSSKAKSSNAKSSKGKSAAKLTNKSAPKSRNKIPKETCNRQADHLNLFDSLPTVCGFTQCAKQFLEKYSKSKKNEKLLIPPIRHILWKSDQMSDYFVKQLRTWIKIYPDWTYVLWNDEDLDPFVQKYFPGKVWQKFDTLPKSGRNSILRIDMVRYLILYQFGGVYADMDYSLSKNLDWYRQFPSVITREPEAHAISVLGAEWPIPILGNPAFLMSMPKSKFMKHCIDELADRCTKIGILAFAGPTALSNFLHHYHHKNPSLRDANDFTYIPPSFSFYPYERNSLLSSKADFVKLRKYGLNFRCRTQVLKKRNPAAHENLLKFCKDTSNFKPITDSNHEIVAIHDLNKNFPVYDKPNHKQFQESLKNLRYILMSRMKFGFQLKP